MIILLVEVSLDNVRSRFSRSSLADSFVYLAGLVLQVIIADLTSLRSRLFFSFVPALPFIVSRLRYTVPVEE